MNVEKVIRILGYIVYTALWSPIILLVLVVTPIVQIAMTIRFGTSVRAAIDNLKDGLMYCIQHDIDFIKTGKW